MSDGPRSFVFRQFGVLFLLCALGACDAGGESAADEAAVDTSEDAQQPDDSGETSEVLDEDTAVDDSGGTQDAEPDAPLDVGLDAEPDARPALPCDPVSPVGLAGCVEQARWEADMAALPTPRVLTTDSWQAAQDLCATRFEELGFEVQRDDWGGGVNVVGTLAGTSGAAEAVVIGAHYDTTDGVLPGGGYCPGADDNGSGVAGVLEAARVLASVQHERTLIVACWDGEESGLLGSRVHAERLASAGTSLGAVISFEMIAFSSSEPNSQVLPDGFSLFFPETVEAMDAREWRGDFIAAVGDLNALAAIEALETIGQATGVDVVRVAVPLEFRSAVALADLRRSDHAAFWDRNYPAIMLTDTANFRNPNYHCAEGIDSLDTLDAEFASGVVANVVGAVATLLSGELEFTTPTEARVCIASTQEGCAEGERCSVVNVAVVGPVEACVPVLGDVMVGDDCTRTGFGEGDCSPGAACTTYERTFEGESATPACRALCNGREDCGAGERCQAPGGNPFAGVCVTDCSPASETSCPENSRCLLAPGVGERVLGGLCTGWDEPPTPDAACEFEGTCGSGMACALETGTCRPYCDNDNPCGAGERCVDYPVPTSVPGLGYCLAE